MSPDVGQPPPLQLGVDHQQLMRQKAAKVQEAVGQSLLDLIHRVQEQGVPSDYHLEILAG